MQVRQDGGISLTIQVMSEQQLSALLVKLREDAGLREKLQSAADLDAFLAMAKEASFDVSKVDWLRYQAKQTLELSNEELEDVAGGEVCILRSTNNQNCQVFGSSIFGYCN